MVKERPILFQTPMVQSIIAYIKTKTRRTKELEIVNVNPDDWVLEHNIVSQEFFFFSKHEEDLMYDIKCPYGKVGDILWVRETIMNHHWIGEFHYKADKDNSFIKEMKGWWIPSIHMPKEACRIWLEITDIKIERLKDISEEDAIAEGVEPIADGFKNYMKIPKIISTLQCFDKAYYSFLSLWESINGYESSELNPWVWVITFKRVAKP